MGNIYERHALEAVQRALERQKTESVREGFAYGVGVEVVGDSRFLQWVRGEGRFELDVVEVGFPSEREDIIRGCRERGLVPKPELREFNIWQPSGLPRSWSSEKDLANYLAALLVDLGGEGALSFVIFPSEEDHTPTAIDEGFPVRYRVDESKPSTPDWASEVQEPHEGFGSAPCR